MISLGPQTQSSPDHQTLLKAKARLEKSGQGNNCMVMPISDARLSAGLIPMPYPLNFMPNFLKMGVPYPFPPAPGALSPSMVNMASLGLMRELEAQATKLKEEAKAASNTGTVRNTIGLGGGIPSVVSHQIEMPQAAPASRTNTTTPSEVNPEDETGSSTAASDQSSDSDFEDEERVLVRKWERDRCDIAWRWSWVQLQVEELKRKLEDCEREEELMLRKKQKYVPDYKEEDGEEVCVRTCGFAPHQSRKKLVIREKPSAVLTQSAHSVLKVKVPKRKHVGHYEDEDEYKPSHGHHRGSDGAPKKKRNPTPLRVHTPVPQSHGGQRDKPPKARGFGGSRPGSPKVGSPKVGSPGKEAFSPRTRRARKRDEYSVDNVVIPFSGTLTPRVYKDIVTPSWQEIGDLEPDIDAALNSRIEEESASKRRKVEEEQAENAEKERVERDGETPSVEIKLEAGDGVGTEPEERDEQRLQGLDIRELTARLDEDESTEPETDAMDFPPNFEMRGDGVDSHDGNLYPAQSSELSQSVEVKPVEVEPEQPSKGSNEPSDDTKDLNSKGSNHNVRLLSESAGPELESFSSDEDTSDEAFAQRHFCRELLERRRYLFPDRNRSLPATPDQLPPEFFVTSLSSLKLKKKKLSTAEEMEKLKKKFDKIRGRYMNDPPPSRNWEELRHLATVVKEVEEEEEEFVEKIDFVSEWDSGCSEDDSEDDDFNPSDFDRWELVSRPPVFDEQGRERNIIYLRRVSEVVAVVE